MFHFIVNSNQIKIISILLNKFDKITQSKRYTTFLSDYSSHSGKELLNLFRTTDLLNTQLTKAIVLIIMLMSEGQNIKRYVLNVNLKNLNKSVDKLLVKIKPNLRKRFNIKFLTSKQQDNNVKIL